MSTGTLPPAAAALTPAAPGSRTAAATLLFGCALLLVLTIGSVWAARQQTDDLFSDVDGVHLRQAGDTLDVVLDQQRARLIASVEILSEDTRIRSTATTTGFDEGTLRDVLQDLKQVSHADVLAVLDDQGKVRAITGAEGLRQMDLSSSPVIKAALERPASNFWTLPEQVLLIGVAPIRSGPRVSALLLMGLALGKQQMTAIQRATGVKAAIFVGDKMIATSNEEPEMTEVFRTANAAGGIDARVIAGYPQYMVRVTRTSDSATAAKVVWVTPRQKQLPAAGVLRIATWMPAVFAAMTLGLALFVTRKRNGGL